MRSIGAPTTWGARPRNAQQQSPPHTARVMRQAKYQQGLARLLPKTRTKRSQPTCTTDATSALSCATSSSSADESSSKKPTISLSLSLPLGRSPASRCSVRRAALLAAESAMPRRRDPSPTLACASTSRAVCRHAVTNARVARSGARARHVTRVRATSEVRPPELGRALFARARTSNRVQSPHHRQFAINIPAHAGVCWGRLVVCVRLPPDCAVAAAASSRAHGTHTLNLPHSHTTQPPNNRDPRHDPRALHHPQALSAAPRGAGGGVFFFFRGRGERARARAAFFCRAPFFLEGEHNNG